MPPKKKTTTRRTKRSTKKTNRTETPPGPSVCEVCGKPIPYGKRCLLHEGLHHVVRYAERQERNGNAFAAFLARLGGQAVERGYQQNLHQKAYMLYVMRQQQKAQQRAQQQHRQQNQPPPPPPQAPDPFVLLGLDRAGATAEQIRARQRELARIFHSDAGGGAAAQERLSEINAAADEAVRQVSGQRSATEGD